MKIGEVEVFATANHPVFVVNKQEFVPFGEVVATDFVLSPSGITMPVHSVRSLKVPPQSVYNLEVEDFHTYYVAGADSENFFLVHNCNGAAGYADGAEKAAKQFVDSIFEQMREAFSDLETPEPLHGKNVWGLIKENLGDAFEEMLLGPAEHMEAFVNDLRHAKDD